MNFFTRRSTSGTRALSKADRIILYAGQITDAVILESWARNRAESIARHRKETEDLERQYPGYREELNRQRSLAGLPPL